MKILQKTTMIAAAVGLMIGATASAADLDKLKESGKIRIAVANEVPYGYLDIDGKPKGAGPEVAIEILKEMGIEDIEWQATDFSSLIPGLQADRFDMVAAEMAILPQRCDVVDFSEPDSSYGEGLLVAKDNPKDIHKYTDFVDSDYKVAIMAGADQLEMMQALGVDEDRLVTISSNSDAISTVSTGRADAYAATGLTAAGLADKSDKVELAKDFEDPVIDDEPVRSWGGFVVKKGSDDFLKELNETLAEFKKTDRWVEILDNYGFTEQDREESNAKTTEQLCSKD